MGSAMGAIRTFVTRTKEFEESKVTDMLCRKAAKTPFVVRDVLVVLA